MSSLKKPAKMSSRKRVWTVSRVSESGGSGDWAIATVTNIATRRSLPSLRIVVLLLVQRRARYCTDLAWFDLDSHWHTKRRPERFRAWRKIIEPRDWRLDPRLKFF